MCCHLVNLRGVASVWKSLDFFEEMKASRIAGPGEGWKLRAGVEQSCHSPGKSRS